MNETTDTRDETCEGFTNWITFAVAIRADSDSLSSHDWVRSFVWELEEAGRSRYEIADALKDYYETAMPELDSPFSEMLRAGLNAVDWEDLAEHWTDHEWRSYQ